MLYIFFLFLNGIIKKIMNWYLKVLRQYADFSGRARRKEYWMFTLFNTIFLIVAIIVDNVIKLTLPGVLPYGILYFICAFAVLIPGLAVSVRRLHDVGKSGWMILISLIPIVGSIWLLVLLVTESDPYENAYGQNPKSGNAYELNTDTEKTRNALDILVFISIAYWFVVNSVNFLIQKLVESWYNTPMIYFQVGSNIIFAIIPVIIALSVRNKNLKIIAIILSALISINILYANLDWLYRELKNPDILF